MATRSYIGKLESNGNTVSYIYCHWDGYLSHNGEILQEHYNDVDEVDQLLKLGDISALEPALEGCKPYNDPDMNVSYKSLEKYNSSPTIEYFYLFTNEGWKVSVRGGEWMMLEDALQDLVEHLQ